MKATENTEGLRIVAEGWAEQAQLWAALGDWQKANHCASQATRVWRKVEWEPQV